MCCSLASKKPLSRRIVYWDEWRSPEEVRCHSLSRTLKPSPGLWVFFQLYVQKEINKFKSLNKDRDSPNFFSLTGESQSLLTHIHNHYLQLPLSSSRKADKIFLPVYGRWCPPPKSRASIA